MDPGGGRMLPTVASTVSILNPSVRRISFPEGHLDHATGLLRRELIGLYRQLRAGRLFPNTAKDHGFEIIAQTHIELGLNIERYLKSRQLSARFDPAAQQSTLTQAQTRWSQIVTDVTQQTPSTVSQGGFCSCQEHQTLSAASVPYWLTPPGFLRRILGLSQDFVYRLLNLSFQLAAHQNSAYGLQWIMHNDDRLCRVCLKYGTGGEQGFYRLHGFRPDPPPVHPGCRCKYQLVLKN
jgi:hypothetical protein